MPLRGVRKASPRFHGCAREALARTVATGLRPDEEGDGVVRSLFRDGAKAVRSSMPSSRRTSRLFHCTKWTCTILAGVMIVAWVGSQWYGFQWYHRHGGSWLAMNGGRDATKGWWKPPQAASGLVPFDRFTWTDEPELFDVPGSRDWRPRLYRDSSDGTIFFWLPYWLPTLVFAVPAAWMWRVDVKRRRAAREGCCAKCGYLLVGLAASKACPECGTSFGP